VNPARDNISRTSNQSALTSPETRGGAKTAWFSMASSSRGSRLRLPRLTVRWKQPRPRRAAWSANRCRRQTFLGVASLQTGTELISSALLFGKAISVFGLLAAVTSHGVSALQLSRHITGVLALLVLVWCIPHIRKQTPLQNLVLAWLYLVDAAVSTAFTALFAASWFLTTTPLGDGRPAAGEGEPTDEMAPRETAVSLTLVVSFTLLRLYFAAVVMSHTSVVLQRHGGAVGGSEDAANGAGVGNPFAPGAPAGEGWRGKAGRALVYVGQDYWLGAREDEDWEARMKPELASMDARSAQVP